MAARVRVAVEAAPKKTFLIALDWPGWARAGKTEEGALDAFLRAAPRYASVAARAGLTTEFGDLASGAIDIDVVERLPGDTNTEFGVPRQIGASDAEPTDAAQADRLATLVDAAWATFDDVAAAAPEELRKGPRGGGRNRTKIVDHVNGADAAYAGVMGIATRALDVKDLRARMLEAVRAPSDGSPLAGKKWPARYAARRIAWHALDHAWEIEDRSGGA
jgi:hypothetical protein